MSEREAIFMQRVQTVTEAHLDDEAFGVPMLAAALSMSRVQLHRRLRRVAGVSPGVLIHRARLRRAATLLREERLTVTEAVYAVGWSNLSYFAKAFQAHFGVVPSAYAAAAA